MSLIPWKKKDALVIPKDQVIIYSRMGCKYCAKAKRIFKEHNLSYEDRSVNLPVHSRELIALMKERGVPKSKITVPQVWFWGEYIGGEEDVERYFKKEG